MTDLSNRADVEVLLRRFYGRVFADDVLAEPFSELRERGLESHLPVMCDFWETVLFRAGLYRGNALQVHRQLNERHPLGANHFARWLALWESTIDEMHQGPVAERAKLQAARIANSMHRCLRGIDAAPSPASAPRVRPHQFVLGRDVPTAVHDVGPEQVGDRRAERVHQSTERP
jgi:hemoglobin